MSGTTSGEVKETEAPPVDASIGDVSDTTPAVKAVDSFQALVADVRLNTPLTRAATSDLSVLTGDLRTDQLYRSSNFNGAVIDRMSPTTGDRSGLGPDGKPLKTSPEAAVIRPTDQIQPPPTDAQALDSYTRALREAGVQNPEEIARKTLERIKSNFDGITDPNEKKGTPAEQLARMARAMEQTLSGSRGQGDPLGANERKLLVADLAMRMMDPEKFANQGRHNTCALATIQKQMMQGGDPARFAEHLANIANHGFTEVTDRGNPPVTRTVAIDSRSLVPDQEAMVNPESRIVGDKVRDGRGMAGLLSDAFLGQLAADRRGQNEVYFASNARAVGAPDGRGATGEGLFKRGQDGSLSFLGHSPAMACADTARLSWALGLPPGSAFVQDSMAYQLNGQPPLTAQERGQYQLYGNTADLHQRLLKFQQAYGMPGELTVNAPFLPGGGMEGHGLHSVNVKANANGTFDLDNNWSTGHDLKGMTLTQLRVATDPTLWRPGARLPVDQVPGPGVAPVPDTGLDDPLRVPTDRVPGRPDPGFDTNPGRFPNEQPVRRLDDDSAKLYRDRIDALRKQAEDEALRRLQNATMPSDITENQEHVEAIRKAGEEFARLFGEWETKRSADEKFEGSPPDFNSILFNIMVRSSR